MESKTPRTDAAEAWANSADFDTKWSLQVVESAEMRAVEIELAEARAEIERLKHEATSAAISGQCMMEEKDNEYVLQRNELEAARAEIDRKDALIKQMVEALESWITRLDLKLSDSIQMTNAAVEAWRLHNENRQN